MSIFSWIGKAASSVGQWLGKAFTAIEKDAAPVAVAILEEIKALFDSGAADFVAKTIDALTKSGIAESIIADIKPWLPKLIADGLAIEGLPDNATLQQQQDWVNNVLKAFGVTADKSKFYSTLGAQIVGIIRANTAPGTKFTFAILVQDLEEAYQDYQDDLAAQNNGEAA